MAKSKKKGGVMDTIREGASLVSDMIFSNVFTRVNEEADVLMNKVERKALVLEEELLDKVRAAVIIGLGMLFVVLAILFFLMEEMTITKWQAYLGVGILVMLVGLLYKIHVMNKERER